MWLNRLTDKIGWMSWPFGVTTGYLGNGRVNWYDRYGSIQLTQTSPVQSPVEPISLQEAKDACRIIDGPIADAQQDRRLQFLISVARSTAESMQGRRLVQSQWDLVFDLWPDRKIRLVPPLVSIDLLQYTDNNRNVVTLVKDVDYNVDTAKVPPIITPVWDKWWPVFSPMPSSSILVRHTTGYLPSDPFWTVSFGATIKEGMLKLIQLWYNTGLPVQKGLGTAEELPWMMSQLLSYGKIEFAG